MSHATPRELLMEVEDRMRLEVKRVEKQAGQAVTAAFAMALVALAVSAWAVFGNRDTGLASDEGLVTGSRFVLQDRQGRTRGEWLVEEDGTTRIVLSDRSGGQRMMLSVLGEGTPGLSLSDQQGNRRVVMGLQADQTSNLVFADAQGIARAVLGMSANQRADLIFADRDGQARVGLGVDAEGSSTMFLPDEGVPPAGSGNQ
ncbi:MAG: hypothetical protein OEO23_02055 [Gemmatimonadota bacterium]|nr:hypothetical protein [Gemmatimonadota bacterium]